ncbi:MAG: class I SAM-dependent methyltransferase [Verrucomicrobiales bacterium]|nr:class I SAM-dependent methyltransferase [Verrucomicrobiales bacterium]
MTLVRFLDESGQFNYDQYRAVQVEGNLRKLDRVWALEPNLKFAAERIRRWAGEPLVFGLCHGTRRGLEQRWLAQSLGCQVLGTDISESATQFENSIQWDFHQAKPEWLGSVDFIYSNSWDHSFDPETCMQVWLSCLRPGGVCVLEHSSEHEPISVRALDPFKVTLPVLTERLEAWGRGQWTLREVVETPSRVAGATSQHLIVLQRTGIES